MESKIKDKIDAYRRKRDSIREFIYFYTHEEERLFQELMQELQECHSADYPDSYRIRDQKE